VLVRVKNSFPGGTSKVVTVPTVAFLFGSEFEGNSNKVAKEMGVSTIRKSKLSASSDVEDQPSCGSVHSVKRKGKKSGNAAKPFVGEQQKKHSSKAASEAAGAKQLDPMAVILESAEEGKYNHNETIIDNLMVKKSSYTYEEMIKILAKGGGKEAEEDAAQFLFAYNLALATDPKLTEKLRNAVEIPCVKCSINSYGINGAYHCSTS
jgi:hypothetical protein